jgi:Prokaryotic membrane lipoprotein lipid attachment site
MKKYVTTLLLLLFLSGCKPGPSAPDIANESEISTAARTLENTADAAVNQQIEQINADANAENAVGGTNSVGGNKQ